MNANEPIDPTSGALTRRRFLEVGAVGGSAALVGCAGEPRPADSQDGSAAAAPGSGGTIPGFELDEMTVSDLQDGMSDGRWTAARLTELYLERIEAVDRSGPRVRSVIETNPDALQIAEGLDRERANGRLRGPLHGIPVLVKDNVATADRMNTTAGSYALEGQIPSADSHVARRLREAGAVILGKANLSEWANFRSTRSSSGWSGRGGQCRNPYALDRNPCGSSSGSGAAAAANLCALAVGTETNGSIVCPSSANGLVGIKPTVGLVSRARIIPISRTQDTAGPMTRTVRDGAVLLAALAGRDPEDPHTAEAATHAADYAAALDPAGLTGARIGVARQYFGFHEGVDALMEDAIEALRAGGAEVIDPVEIATRSEMRGPSFQVMLYEFKADLNTYLEALPPAAPVRSLEQLIAFNLTNAAREMPYFGQELLEQAQEKGPLDEPEYLQALEDALRLSRDEGMDATMDDDGLDAMVAPTGSPAWSIDLLNGDRFLGSSSSPAAISGYPNVTVPAGMIHGLPVGISFFGRRWSESVLLRIAYAFEQATNHRRAPTFRPTIELG